MGFDGLKIITVMKRALVLLSHGINILANVESNRHFYNLIAKECCATRLTGFEGIIDFNSSDSGQSAKI